MRVFWLLLLTLASFGVCAADIKYKAKGSETTASIIADVCLHDIATGTLRYGSATSEDSGLVITLTSSDGVTVLVYDATTEVETITTNYTWVAPSASNIRFKVQTNGCYQLMPAANTFDVGDHVFLTIADSSSPAFMDYEGLIQFLGTAADTQADVVAGLTTFGGATETNVNANETKIDIVDDLLDTEVAAITGFVDDIGVAGAGLTNINLPNQTMDVIGTWTGNIVGTLSTLTTYTGNTLQTGDSFARIGAAGAGLTAVSIATGGIAAGDFASGAIDADAIAASAIGAPEIATDAIGAPEIATDAIGSLETAASFSAEVQQADVDLIETLDATDQLDAHAASGLDAAGVRGAVGLATANLDTQLTNIESGVDVDTIEGVDATNQLDAHAASGLDAAGVRAAVGLASANLDTQIGAVPTVQEIMDHVVDGTLDVEEILCYLAAVLVNESDFDDTGLDSAEFMNAAGTAPKVTVTYAGTSGQDRSVVTLAACGS